MVSLAGRKYIVLSPLWVCKMLFDPLDPVVVNSKLVPWPNGKSFYRLSYFVPLLTSAVIASLMFSILYDYNSGLINSYLMQVFGEDAKVGWVRDANIVKFSIILLLIWRYTGINSLYFVAAASSNSLGIFCRPATK